MKLQVSPVHYLDATSLEEAATPLRLLLLFSYQKNTSKLQGMRLLGPGEANVAAFTPLVRVRGTLSSNKPHKCSDSTIAE